MTSYSSLQAAYRRRDLIWIRKLVWTYFVLLIFEGALRKWFVPSAANALLIVRDPVVLATYFLAWRSGIFPRNIFISVLAVIAISSFLASLLVSQTSLVIATYGLRTNFLQLPFIFLIAKVFDLRDVQRIGYWTLVIAIPMGALMALQFLAPPHSFINSGAGDSFEQLSSALGRIRPPGTFSFVTGVVYFYSMVTAFLLYSQFDGGYPRWLVAGATLAMLCAVAVSGSRGLIGNIAVVFIVGLLVSSVLKPRLAWRWLGGALVVLVAVYFLSHLSFFQIGLATLDQRVTNASRTEGGSTGLLARILAGYTGFLPALYNAPLLGQGLGMGTNVGLMFIADKSQFIWFEDEWARHILESGPLLGGAFVLYRIALTLWIGVVAIARTARRDPLASLLFGAVSLMILRGSLGQSTSLGFTVLLGGLCLAATRVPRAQTAQAATSTVATVDEAPTETKARLRFGRLDYL